LQNYRICFKYNIVKHERLAWLIALVINFYIYKFSTFANFKECITIFSEILLQESNQI